MGTSFRFKYRFSKLHVSLGTAAGIIAGYMAGVYDGCHKLSLLSGVVLNPTLVLFIATVIIVIYNRLVLESFRSNAKHVFDSFLVTIQDHANRSLVMVQEKTVELSQYQVEMERASDKLLQSSRQDEIRSIQNTLQAIVAGLNDVRSRSQLKVQQNPRRPTEPANDTTKAIPTTPTKAGMKSMATLPTTISKCGSRNGATQSISKNQQIHETINQVYETSNIEPAEEKRDEWLKQAF